MPFQDSPIDPTHWMRQVLQRQKAATKSPSEKNIHKLRVALRRCRTIAEAIRRVDPHPAWRKMRRRAKSLFSTLGPAREAQVLIGWIDELSDEPDALGSALLGELRREEARGVRTSKKAAAGFDRAAWKKLARKIHRRFQELPHPRLVASHLILERWATATEDNLTALRGNQPLAWHQARISIKRFRYTWEAFAPRSLKPVLKELQFAQDALGDVHDLDVLQDRIDALAKKNGESTAEWTSRIRRRRTRLLTDYRQRTMQRQALWTRLRGKLASGRQLEAAGVARLIAQAHALGWTVGHEPRRFALAQRMLEEQLARESDIDLRRARKLLSVALRVDPGPDADHRRNGGVLEVLERPLGWSREDLLILRDVLAPNDPCAGQTLKSQERAIAEDVRAALEASWI